MIVKEFTGRTVQDALEKVRESFGSDAVILDTHFNRAEGRLAGDAAVVVTAAFESDPEPVSEVEGRRSLSVDPSLLGGETERLPGIPDQTLQQPEIAVLSTEEANAVPVVPVSRIDEELQEVLRSVVAGAGIQRALLSWLLTQPSLSREIIDAFAADVAHTVPGCDQFLDGYSKGITALFVGERGTGRSTALFKCLGARWRERKETPRALIVCDSEEHAQERLQSWSARCTIRCDVVRSTEALRKYRPVKNEDLLIEYVPDNREGNLDDAAQRMLRKLRPNVVVQVISAVGSDQAWIADAQRFAPFRPTHLHVSHADAGVRWWDLSRLLKTHAFVPGYRSVGADPFGQLEPIAAVDWTDGITAEVLRAQALSRNSANEGVQS